MLERIRLVFKHRPHLIKNALHVFDEIGETAYYLFVIYAIVPQLKKHSCSKLDDDLQALLKKHLSMYGSYCANDTLQSRGNADCGGNMSEQPEYMNHDCRVAIENIFSS